MGLSMRGIVGVRGGEQEETRPRPVPACLPVAEPADEEGGWKAGSSREAAVDFCLRGERPNPVEGRRR